MTNQEYVGIDVSKKWLEAGEHERVGSKKVRNDVAGIRAYLQKMGKNADRLIAVEATGGYERLVVKLLIEHGEKVAVVNPTRVRRFA